MIARLRIEQAGPLTSIQDAGRPGWRRFGVPPSGPIDRLAFAAGQAALGLTDGAAIELSHGGLTLMCAEGAVAVAITGGDFTGERDGAAIGAWTCTTLAPGQRLRIAGGAAGNWAYLAVAGDLQRHAWLGSRATHLLAGLGGGRVAAGDVLSVAQPRGARAGAIPRPVATEAIETARIVMGPQDRYFATATIARLTQEAFSATARFDRMGMVLDGPPLPPTRIDMPSAPAIRGALQVDGDGRLSLLLADHQTTGGYPRIATVIDADVDRIAQLRPAASLRFVAVDAADAVAGARRARAETARYLDAVRRRDPPDLLATNLIGGVVDARRP